jgi:hypothetical protein
MASPETRKVVHLMSTLQRTLVWRDVMPKST